MPEHPYGWLSIAPPVVAILLAIVTQRVVLSLLAGLAVGALIITGGDPIQAFVDLLETNLWHSLIQPGQLRIFAFTLLCGAMIGVIHISGGMLGLADAITPWAQSRRSGQLATWCLGLIIFFDDYANCLLIGNAMRPTTDRLKISREKLAYIVDCTAATVAGIALVSTWIAVELAYLREGLSNLDPKISAGLNPFELFVACIPYRFYVIQTLVFVALVAILRRDFGPMLKAERKALAGQFNAPKFMGSNENPYDDGQLVPTSHWTNAGVPLAVTLAVVIWLIYATGAAAVAKSQPGLVGMERIREAFGSADSSLALCYGGLAGLTVAWLMARWRAGIHAERILAAAGRGARIVLPAMAILWVATAMSRMTSNKSVDGQPSTTPYEFKDSRLYTGDFLKQQLLAASDGSPETFARWMPTIVFLLASVVSFCTGTAYGTMGILVPMVVPLAAATVGATSPEELAGSPIFIGTLGCVLSGAIMGDHVSPVSDTAILSAQASSCDLMAHVYTQIVYAAVVGAVSTLLGTVLVGYGVSVWIILPLQVVVLAGVILVFGKRVDG